MHKLILGSAQFAEDYGVVRNKKPLELFNVLNLCKREGIEYLDTSIDYKNAHKIIKDTNKEFNFKIITKISFKNLEINKCSEAELEKALDNLMFSLDFKNIYCVMIHKSSILKSKHSNFILNRIRDLKIDGKIKKIGLSIYEPQELKEYYDLNFDIIQGPFNILDQRIKTSGWLDKIHNDNKEFHARSIFLQGLLAQSSKSQIPSKFLKWESFWDRWFTWHKINNQKTIHTCLSFVLSELKINNIIIGVDNLNHIKEIFELYKSKKVKTNLLNDLQNININDELLIDPRNWKKFNENWK